MLLLLVILSNNGLFHSYKYNSYEMPMSSMHQEENDTAMKKFNSNRWRDYEMSRSRRGSRCLVLASFSLYLYYSFASTPWMAKTRNIWLYGRRIAASSCAIRCTLKMQCTHVARVFDSERRREGPSKFPQGVQMLFS